MARGNDASAATQEFVGQYGVHPNAEALVNAHRAASDPALERAQMTAIDAEKTAELDLSEIEAEQGGEVLDAAVRGNAIVYVAEGEDGRTYKGILPHSDKYKAPAGSAQANAERAALQGDVELARKGAEIQAKIDAEVEEARAAASEKYGQELQEFQQEQAEKAAEAAEVAQAEAEEAEKGAAETEGKATKQAKAETKKS